MNKPSESEIQNQGKNTQCKKFFKKMNRMKDFIQKIFIDDYTGKNKSGWKWFITTVPICVFPTLLVYIGNTIILEKPVELSTYTGDVLLIIVSVSCSFIFLCFSTQEKHKGSGKAIAGTIGVLLAVFASFIYAFIKGADRSISEEKFYIGCILVVLLFSCIGIVIGNHNDKTENQYHQKKISNCHELFEMVMDDYYSESFEGLSDESAYCELQEYDLIEKIKRQKKRKENNANT